MAAAFQEIRQRAACLNGGTSSELSVAHPQRADQTSVTARAQRAGKADARQRRRWNSEGSVPSLAPREPAQCPPIHQASLLINKHPRKALFAAAQARTAGVGVPRQTLRPHGRAPAQLSSSAVRWLSRSFCILKPRQSSKPRLALQDPPCSLADCLMRLSNCRPPVELATAAGLIIDNGTMTSGAIHPDSHRQLTRGLPLGCRLGQCSASSLAPLCAPSPRLAAPCSTRDKGQQRQAIVREHSKHSSRRVSRLIMIPVRSSGWNGIRGRFVAGRASVQLRHY